MELVEGIDLSDYINSRITKNIVPTPSEIQNLLLNIALGVKQIHQKGYAHRDIKLENVIYNPRIKQIRIIDFGLICSSACKNNAGTPLYIPPELFKPNTPDSLQVSQAHDIWSLGVLFYVIANQRYPYPQYSNTEAVLKNIRDAKINKSNYVYPLPSTDVSPSVAVINKTIDSMLNPNWQTRPNIDQVIALLTIRR